MSGIQNIPLRIPTQWSAEWFDTFVREVLAKLDTRNSVGTGIAVSSDGNSVATLEAEVTQTSVDADIAAHVAEADPHPGYLTQAEADALYLTQTQADALYEPTASILAVTTVGALPTAVGKQGVRCFVTDANATTFASTVAAGGSNKVPVVSDGTNWIIG